MAECITQSIWLVRHPETDWNEQKRYQGKSDRPLSSAGEQAVKQIAEFFCDKPLSRLFCSERSHTETLARAIGRSTSAPLEPQVHPGLNEIDHGLWEGLTYGEVQKQFQDSYKLRFSNVADSKQHEGESLREVRDRVQKAWREILESEPGELVLVSHATPIQLILCEALNLSFENYWQFQISTGSITKLERAEDGCILCQLNYQTH